MEHYALFRRSLLLPGPAFWGSRSPLRQFFLCRERNRLVCGYARTAAISCRPMPRTQNIYDDPKFFEGYERLRQSRAGLNEVLEQPALRSVLPASLAGMRVLDLGCGFGDFAREARREGALLVVGIDPSRRMLERAIALTQDPAIEYRR